MRRGGMSCIPAGSCIALLTSVFGDEYGLKLWDSSGSGDRLVLE